MGGPRRTAPAQPAPTAVCGRRPRALQHCSKDRRPRVHRAPSVLSPAGPRGIMAHRGVLAERRQAPQGNADPCLAARPRRTDPAPSRRDPAPAGMAVPHQQASAGLARLQASVSRSQLGSRPRPQALRRGRVWRCLSAFRRPVCLSTLRLPKISCSWTSDTPAQDLLCRTRRQFLALPVMTPTVTASCSRRCCQCTTHGVSCISTERLRTSAAASRHGLCAASNGPRTANEPRRRLRSAAARRVWTAADRRAAILRWSSARRGATVRRAAACPWQGRLWAGRSGATQQQQLFVCAEHDGRCPSGWVIMHKQMPSLVLRRPTLTTALTAWIYLVEHNAHRVLPTRRPDVCEGLPLLATC